MSCPSRAPRHHLFPAVLIGFLLTLACSEVARAQGAPQFDSYLGVHILTSGAARPNEPVVSESHGNVVRTGAQQHGLVATSATGGYSENILNAIRNFSSAPFSYETTGVLKPDGTAGTLGTPVDGVRIGEVDEQPVRLPGAAGKFTLNASGTFDFDPGDDFADLAAGASTQVAVEYDVLGTNTTNGEKRASHGTLVVTVSKSEAGDISWKPEGAEFETFGSSNRPVDDHTVFPDLKAYVTSMLRFTYSGGPGTAVQALADGSISTNGASADGILAQTHGLDGSAGRDAGLFRSSRMGAGGGKGGNILVDSTATITTSGTESVGILAASTGGSGGTGGDSGWGRRASSGGPGADGSLVEVRGAGAITTTGNHSIGILAVSAGGNGGAGGGGSTFAGAANGAKGGAGGTVIVNGSWDITTGVYQSTVLGVEAHGIFAKSVGGTAGSGGKGGWTGTNAGGGGEGTWGGTVEVTSAGHIVTYGQEAHGIYGLSVGGFGGSGGSGGSLFYSSGGNGSGAGSGGNVTITNAATGSIETFGAGSHGIFAQSIGGGGGSGGSSWALAGFGGDSASGGSGGLVTVGNRGSISAHGAGSAGIFAQSIGGSGGTGGVAKGMVAIGGAGSATSHGAAVSVTNAGTISSSSNAIFAQSLGGGGGAGGSASGWFSFGGSGGGGGNGDIVTVSSHGNLTTGEHNASAIFAQSLGGGGGAGGNSTSVGVLATVSIGGSGASGGTGAAARAGVNPLTGAIDPITGEINTFGQNASGIEVQSVGGGGGKGGFAVSVTADVFPVGAGAAFALGGSGGGGNSAGAASVYFGDALSRITTRNANSNGIFVQSVGGGGGAGGFSVAAVASGFSAAISLGGGGGSGGSGNTVTAGSELYPLLGTITTTGWKSYGVLAQSLGGGGGNGGLSVAGAVSAVGVNFAMGGNGSGGGNASTVSMTTHSTITTYGHDSHALFAQSLGGGGGSGGFSVAAGASVFGSLGVGIGGTGAGGGTGGTVTLVNQGTLSTTGDRADGIHAQSVGGGGGSGGFSITAGTGMASLQFGIGGNGGGGGPSELVTVTNGGSITTTGQASHGLFAQSAGGGGGSGGFALSGTFSTNAAVGFALGGRGKTGGDSAGVTVSNSGNITTGGLLGTGKGSYGIFAESVGGGGGQGGFGGSFGLSFGNSSGAGLSVGVGGNGGGGGTAKAVSVTNTGALTTTAASSIGLFAQSVGGGGGDAGHGLSLSIAAQPGQNVSLGIAIGGKGGGGGNGDLVDVVNRSAIRTAGAHSEGIFAQSVGGGGGNGGAAITLVGNLSMNSVTPMLTIGGGGGTGGNGSHVIVTNDGSVRTTGADSIGILAQSLGKGGGNGGLALSAALAGPPSKTLSLSIGGSGAGGGLGGQVDVFGMMGSAGIVTEGDRSHGIEAQSVGGGGGNGGLSAAFSMGLGDTTSSSINVTAAVGGSGGEGNIGGIVNVGSKLRPLFGSITTKGTDAIGILAQSLGGGGGVGGVAFASAITLLAYQAAPSLNASLTLGGAGGSGNDGRAVSVYHDGTIDTSGDSSYGIQAQSVGAGGGNGASARSIPLQLGGAFATTGTNASLGVSIGGSAGAAGSGGLVTVDHRGTITTRGGAAYGIYAQSIGGGGGNGGDGYMGFPGDTLLFKFNKSTFYAGLKFVMGGSGGASGDGNAVTVGNSGALDTWGDGSAAIFAQSIGGGGGAGGNGVLGLGLALFSGAIGGGTGTTGDGGSVTVRADGSITTRGLGAEGIFAQSTGGGGGKAGGVERGLNKLPIIGETNWNIGWGPAFGQDGGSGGNGGNITIDSKAAISTLGAGSTGIFAQSIGGGGGLVGSLGRGLNFAGSVGGYGSAGTVSVTQSGSIFTFGDGADGIVAQSAGGRWCSATDPTNLCSDLSLGSREYKGTGGAVSVTLTGGSIITSGARSDGILAQSVGQGGAGDIKVSILDAESVISGGSNGGAAVRLLDGNRNTITSYGTLTTADPFGGTTIVGGVGSDTVENWGALFGSVNLGGGKNAFTNHAGAALYSGATMDLGDAGVFSNAGLLSPGGIGTVQSTSFTGEFTQSGQPRWLVDVTTQGVSDSMTVAGHARFGDSITTVDVFTPGTLEPGRYTLFSAYDGVLGAQFRLGTLYGSMPLYHTLDFENSNVAQQLTVLPSTGTFYWTGAIGESWAAPFVSGVSNWSRDASSRYIYGTPGAASDVIFTGGGAAPLGADFAVQSLSFATGSNAILGDGHALTVMGNAGRGISVAASAVIGTDIVLGASQSWETNGSLLVNGSRITGSGAQLTIGGTGTTVLDAPIHTGGGALIKTGTGLLVLNGSNSYSGGTVIDGGTLVGNTRSLQGGIVNNAELVFDQAFDGIFSGGISGSGWLVKQSAGALRLAGTNSYSGGTWVREGTLIGSVETIPGSVLNDARLIFDQATSASYAGTLAGTGVFIKQGSGVLTLTGNSLPFKGSTIVETGELVVDGLLGGSSLLLGSNTRLSGTGLVPSTTIGGGAVFAPGHSIGTMYVLGDLRFAPGATYNLEASRGATDLTVVTGSLFLDNASLDVQVTGSDKFRPINTYPIFSVSGGMDGSFTQVTSSASFLNPSLQYYGDIVGLTLRRTDVDFTAGTHGNQTAVAGTLNALVATATGGLADVVNTVYELPAEDARAAMSSMSGVIYQHVARGSLDHMRIMTTASLRRLGELRGGVEGLLREIGTAPAASVDTVGDRAGARYGAWISGIGETTRYYGRSGDAPAKSPSRGVVFGFDTHIGDRLSVGVSGGEAWPDVTLDGTADRVSADMVLLDLYGRYAQGANRFDGVVGLGRVDHESFRLVTVGTGSAPARSVYRGEGVSFQAEYGRRFAVGRGFALEPTLGLQVAQMRFDGVNERDAGLLALAVPERTVRSERLLTGGTIAKSLGLFAGTRLSVQARAAWAHEFRPLADIGVRFQGDPFNNTFRVTPPRDARDSGLFGFGLVGDVPGRVRLFADVTGEAGGPSRSLTGNVGVMKIW